LLLAAAAALALLSAQTGTAQPIDPVQRARAFLEDNATELNLRPGLTDLRAADHRQSLTGEHVRFQQTRGGVDVFGATVTVSLPGNGDKPLVRSRYASLPASAAPVAVSRVTALEAAVGHIGATPGDTTEVAPARLTYFPTSDKTLTPAWQLTVRTTRPYGTWLVLADAATGEILYRHNLLRFDSGTVFDPNPAVSNGGVPPATHCDGAVFEDLLDDEYVLKTLQGITPAQGKLKGQYVDLTAPGISGAYKPAGLADEPTHNYNGYGCDDDRFEEVMVYHHLDRTQRKIQALGFAGAMGILSRPVPAHAHFMPDCNAFFDPADRGLHFGDFDGPGYFPTGCAMPPLHDSGEDADWIIHEYGHAIQDDQVPGWAFGPYPLAEQAASIGEGFSDFLAAAMSGDPCWAEYVSFGVMACAGGALGLRSLQNTRNATTGYEACPNVDFNGDPVDGAETEEPHCGGEVWSGALWDLVEAIGDGSATQQARDTVLTLVLEAQFYLDQRANFNEAAAAVCFADTLLMGGANSGDIGAAFAGRGISTAPCAPLDFASYYMRIPHTFSGDLAIDIKVGPGVDQGTPAVCAFTVADSDSNISDPDLYIDYGILGPASCSAYLPPTIARPWWLQVQDVSQFDEGSIEDFEILLPGGSRCISGDPPIAIPDLGAAVYAKIDCSIKVSPPSSTPTPTPAPTPTPGPGAVGNVDCSNPPTAINSVDALKLLRHNAGLSYTQTEPPPCPDIALGVLLNGELQGDVNCTNSVNSVDALLILRYNARLPIFQNEPPPCPDIGS